jgi:hypothetical protein
VSPVLANASTLILCTDIDTGHLNIHKVMISIMRIGKTTASAIKPPDIRFFTVTDFEAQLSGLEKLAEIVEPQGTISEP